MTLDATDLTLIDALQENATQRLEDLGRLVHLAPSSVHDRLRRLEREGVIRRWTIDLDGGAVGLGVLAFIGVKSSASCAQLQAGLEALPEIEEAYSVAGELCLLLKVRVPDTNGLLGIIERLKALTGIESTETTVVLKTMIDRPMALPARAPLRTAKSRNGQRT